MAIRSIQVENFRGLTRVIEFGPRVNIIEGRNESRKSTLKEAICFLFCGTDSTTLRNPTHLITHGADRCVVTAITDKAELSRSLTVSGNGTLKVTRNGVSTALSQTQFEQMLGAGPDLFLAVFLPGYFLTLSSEKKHKLIAEISPPVDRLALLQEVAGFALSAEERLRYALNQRADLVASKVAEDRRRLEKEVAGLQGELRQLQALQPLPKPTEPGEVRAVEYLRELKTSWDRYHREAEKVAGARRRNDDAKSTNHWNEQQRIELRAQLEKLVEHVVPARVLFDAEQAATELMPIPQKPALHGVVEEPHCPTCGQTVGSNHRDQVRKTNQLLMADYENALAFAKEHNAAATARHKEQKEKVRLANESIRDIEEGNREVRSSRQAIEIELAGLVDKELEALPPEPTRPREAFYANILQQAEATVKEYETQVGTYEYVQKQLAEATTKGGELQGRCEQLSQYIARFQTLEQAIKELPAREMRIQASLFDFPGIEVLVERDIRVSVSGIPYGCLSTGKKMKIDRLFSLRINSRMAKPINMLFEDNSDLVDEQTACEAQLFLARVVPGQDLTIRQENT